MAATLVLASSSPRRRELLQSNGYRFRVIPASVEELLPPFLTVGETVLLNAKRKAEEVARRSSGGAVVLAADTLVALDGRALGKPRDLDEATEMLRGLSGKVHEVYSGVWLLRGAETRAVIEISHVTFRKLKSEEIERYLARIDPLDKAGAYAAQEQGSDVIKAVRGSFTNVVGLPMERVVPLLREFGL